MGYTDKNYKYSSHIYTICITFLIIIQILHIFTLTKNVDCKEKIDVREYNVNIKSRTFFLHSHDGV